MATHAHRIVRPLPKGQITIPASMRRTLGITEESLLDVSLEGDHLVISKVPENTFRVYSDSEVEELLAEDRITPETAERVRQLVQDGLL